MSGTHVPNRKWSYRDEAGHGHHFDGDKLPTLEIVMTGTSWCDECGQSHTSHVFVCKECREPVQPEFRYLASHEAHKEEKKSFMSKLMSTPIIRGATGATGATMIPSSSSHSPTIVSVGLRRENEDISVVNGSGVVSHLAGHGRWILEVNGTDIPLTDMEAEVVHATAGNHQAVIEFAQKICVDRGMYPHPR
jgi:hypothetical protein